MDNEELGKKIDELSKRIDKYHEENLKRAEKDKLSNLGWVALAFAVATLSIYLSKPATVNAIIPIVLLIFGVGFHIYSSNKKFK